MTIEEAKVKIKELEQNPTLENKKLLGELYFELANIYFYAEEEKKDFTKILKLYTKAYVNGNVKACNPIGYIYEKGLGVEANPKTAFKFYMISANENDKLGHSNVGVSYYNGVGVEKDLKKAFEHILVSASLGYSVAQLNAGAMYFNGEGTEKDNIKAVYWFEKASKNGNQTAKEYLQKIKNLINIEE